MWQSRSVLCPGRATGQTGSFLNMAPEVVLGERYNETAVRCQLRCQKSIRVDVPSHACSVTFVHRCNVHACSSGAMPSYVVQNGL